MIDPLGLWLLTLEGYAGLGGGINISYSNGTLETTVRSGLGWGIGADFDPTGTPSEHSKQCGNGFVARTTAAPVISTGSEARFGLQLNGSVGVDLGGYINF